jgi:OmcA/MtrC family decaheme c-type cytochrome
MRKYFAGALLALAALTFTNTAFAGDQKRTKPMVDFSATAKLNGSTASLGKTGVVTKIISAAIAKDGTITVRATIVDSDGFPLDRLGAITKGPVTLSFIAGFIPNGGTQYTSYTTAADASGTNSNPSQMQAGMDAGGTFTANAIGDYTYVFKTKAPATFDVTATTSIGAQAFRNMAEFGTFDEWAESSNDVFTFRPDAGAVKTTRSVVVTAACNQCHNPLNAHGGDRLAVEFCIMCHQPQTVNPDTLNTLDMKVFIHKLHMGSSLPSVKAGTPYRVFHRGAWSDFSAVVFPQDVRNCTTCHTAAATQKDNWKTNPSAAACGSCHDDVNLATGTNHAGGPQVNDALCANCHTSQASLDFDASIPGAHVMANRSTSLPGMVTKIISVTGATPGNSPTVTFSVINNAGVPVDISKVTKISVVLGGPNVDYNTGAGAMRISETVSGAAPATLKNIGSGAYTYVMTNKIPAAGAGSYTVSIEATNNVTLLAGTTSQTAAVDIAKPVEFYFSVDKSAMVARRNVVSTANCSACHSDMTFVHGGARAATQECTICHNPALSDGTSGQSVDMSVQIHSIHRGTDLANPYVLGTTNYQSVMFPGDLRSCTTCHMAGTYLPENIGAKAIVASPGGFTKTTPPISAACQGCHDDISTASHALANTTVLGESCAACHSAGEEFSVDRVHQRIF